MKKLLRVFLALFVLLSLSIVFTACSNNACTEHKEKWIIDTPATCTEPGVKHAECEYCKYHMGIELIDATGHNFVNFSCTACFLSQGTEGLTYMKNTEGTGYIVTGIGSAEESDIIIPSKYKNLPVMSISENAFKDNTLITSINIPNSVTSIGSYAFSGCSSLTNITIGDSVTSIGSYAFDDCYKLTSITFPDSVTTIGSCAFLECTSLTSITIPDGVTSIGDGAFNYCTSLTNVTIPDSVTSIGVSAFSNCKSLTSITIPDSVTTIGHYAFSGCSKLTSITIPDSVTSIEERVFEKCVNLIDISVKTNNEVYSSINGNLYNKDGTELIRYAIGKSDSSFTIPSSVTSIGYEAFKDCSSLTSITIPDSVTYVSYFTFEGCNNLQFNAYDNANYLGNDNNPYYALIRIANTNYSNCKIHSGTKIIADGSFTYCNALTSITIPDSVTYICDYAFYGCDSLTSVTIGNGVTHINDFAFDYCSNLTSVNIPDSVTSIGWYAFSSCNSLTNIVIPNSVTFIDSHAFTINNPNFTIYCEATSKPNGWDSSWNSNRPVYWYSESEPTEDGNYWHYDENDEIEIWE